MKQELKEKLKELFEKGSKNNPQLKIAGEYIIWQLGMMKNEELADTTAEEFTKGVFKLSEVWKSITEYARSKAVNQCAVISDSEIYGKIREALKIDKAVEPSETVGFIPSGMAQTEKIPEPTSLGLDLDALFD